MNSPSAAGSVPPGAGGCGGVVEDRQAVHLRRWVSAAVWLVLFVGVWQIGWSLARGERVLTARTFTRESQASPRINVPDHNHPDFPAPHRPKPRSQAPRSRRQLSTAGTPAPCTPPSTTSNKTTAPTRTSTTTPPNRKSPGAPGCLESSKTMSASCGTTASHGPQWSPVLKTRKTRHQLDVVCGWPEPQWSPVLKTGKTADPDPAQAVGRLASMEPGPEDREDSPRPSRSRPRPRSLNGARS